MADERESEFQIFLRRTERQWLEKIYLLGIVLLPLFAFLDYMVAPFSFNDGILHIFWGIRVFLVSLLILQYRILRLMRTSRAGNLVHVALMFLETSLAFGAMILLSGGFESEYYNGLLLTFMAISLFMPWGAKPVLLSGIGISLFYLAENILFDRSYRWGIGGEHLFLLGSAVVIAATISHFKFRLIRNQFMQNHRIRTLHRELTRSRKALIEELHVAGAIQKTILDSPILDRQRCHDTLQGRGPVRFMLESFYRSAGSVGGDFLDMVSLPGRGTAIIIADASGHGVPAALVTALLKLSFHDSVKQHASPKEMLLAVNDRIRGLLRVEDFVTALLLVVCEDGRVLYSNAGHINPIVIRKSSVEIEEWDGQGRMLGLFSNSELPLEERADRLEKGDRILMVTDGILDIFGPAGVDQGLRRVRSLFRKGMDLDLNDASALLMEQIEEQLKERGQQDDAAFLLVEWTGSGETPISECP